MSPPHPLALSTATLITPLGALSGVLMLLLAAPVGGFALAAGLRLIGWRWTWAAVAAPLAWPLGSLSGVWQLTMLLACGQAIRLGRRWQRSDTDLGGDLAQGARAAFGPTDFARRIRGAWEIRRERWVDRRGLLIGTDARGLGVRIPLGGDSGSHTLVVGASGTGKTVTQISRVVRAVEHGHGAIVCDPKGDCDLESALRRVAREQGRRMLVWTPEGKDTYNPYGYGSDSEIADKALAVERYTEPHYLRQAQRYLGHAVRTMRLTGVPVSPASLVRYLDPLQLEVLARRIADEEQARTVWRYLDSLSARQLRDLGGTRDRLAILPESDIGRWLDPEAPGAETFDLLQAMRWRAVVYFRLDADRRPLLAQMLAGALVGDVLAAAAALQATPIPTTVMIDEFSAIAADQVAGLFARSRAAGISLLLGTQELSDLRRPGSDALRDQVLGNVETLIAHRQVVPASAQLVCDVAGGRGAWAGSERTHPGWPSLLGATGGSRSRVREPLILPDPVRTLPTGVAAVVVPGARRAPKVARILRAG